MFQLLLVIAEDDAAGLGVLDDRERFEVHAAFAESVAAALEALFDRAADADERCPRLLYDLAQTAQRFAAGKKVVYDEHTLSRTDPVLCDEQRDLLL